MPDVTADVGCQGMNRALAAVCGRRHCAGSGLRVVVLVPAYNEAGSIEATLDGLMSQVRQPERIVVIPNGCTDDTARRARKYPVTVLELPRLAHRKSEALNRGWKKYAKNADVVVCLDADTVLPPNAIQAWTDEFTADHSGLLGGSSSKFTMQQPGLLSRLQKAEFAMWTDDCLRRGSTSVLAGTGCAINNRALKQLADREDRDGPWIYTSQVEDFELTYRIRELGYHCQVSPVVRAYTDSMRTIKSLWAQRMKWQAGTVEDLLQLGVNKLTLHDWALQGLGFLNVMLRLLWIFVLAGAVAVGGELHVTVMMWLPPILFAAVDIKRALRIPHRDWKDLLIAATLLPQEFFMWLRSGWLLVSWWSVLIGKVTQRQVDRWETQYAAEEVN